MLPSPFHLGKGVSGNTNLYSLRKCVLSSRHYSSGKEMVYPHAGTLVCLHKNSYLLGLAEKEPSVPQAELLLLPKDQEMIEISDDEKTSDHNVASCYCR